VVGTQQRDDLALLFTSVAATRAAASRSSTGEL
jgi:hypothetical protein